MIRQTDKNVGVMACLVTARAHNTWFSREVLFKQQAKVRGNYLDVLLKRFLDDGLTERQKVMGSRGRRVWGYRATDLGNNWYVNPSLRVCPPRSTQEVTATYIPLDGTIERDGWVERWNDQVLHIPEWAARKVRATMNKSRNYHRDNAKQKVHEVPAMKAVCSYGKRTGYTLRLKFRREPWRDHLAEWLGYCGFSVEETQVFIDEIERQLPGSFKQEEHRFTGMFATAAKILEERTKITTLDLDGKLLAETMIERSRRVDGQFKGDAQIVDTMVGALAAYQNAEVIRTMHERGTQKRIMKVLGLIAQGRNKEALKEMGMEPTEEGEDDKWKQDLV